MSYSKQNDMTESEQHIVRAIFHVIMAVGKLPNNGNHFIEDYLELAT